MSQSSDTTSNIAHPNPGTANTGPDSVSPTHAGAQQIAMFVTTLPTVLQPAVQSYALKHLDLYKQQTKSQDRVSRLETTASFPAAIRFKFKLTGTLGISGTPAFDAQEKICDDALKTCQETLKQSILVIAKMETAALDTQRTATIIAFIGFLAKSRSRRARPGGRPPA